MLALPIDSQVQALADTDRSWQHFGCGPKVEPAFSLIHPAIEAQAARAPQNIAASCGGQTITYGELNRQANRLATHLQEQGVVAGDHVALFVERSIPMLVGMLATLKIGAAYVPQHVGITPTPQLQHIMTVACTRIVLTLSTLACDIPLTSQQHCVHLDTFIDSPSSPADEHNASDPDVSVDSLCFVLFTSGTTGLPNGVRVTQRNVCNILLTAPGDLGMRPGLKVGQILNIAFDMAAWEILGCLAHGATLMIRGKNIAETAEQCDVLIATPSILGTLDPARCTTVKVVALAGEPCPQPLADRWASICRFYNACGPTETTIVNTMQHYRGGTALTIGKPTPNNTVYVLDEAGQLCRPGEPGEMWAGGDCVTAGYLGNAQLTAERYRPDPFLGQGRMMFRTRDLGRWTDDGELEHLGRVDDQVKVRGFRVELDSVSAALEASASCERAVTLKLDSRSLVAFVYPGTTDIEAARRCCEERLAYYCVPSLILAVDEIPLTSRGKVDKRLLLEWAMAHPLQQGTVLETAQ
ncbi:amino acid adenylation domain-containing protein [Pseudomonas sp.]|jgi:amino acid adenylation domain-containing protein|uniref:amino acid adenylation domain-containing protein n=1 Tax=Pseudomonas sp. TaxID=306 RepID=UPI002E3435FD|nr:amino acid adenylation domain-containing protein [Pseudomonas sp.]HEX4548211.1 amino acid adenylation domain-containing protein [Pseudomonas sp.]